MRFLVDAQLPVALARWLASEGHHAEHVADLGLEGATDKAIWDFALAMGSVILSKDEDFAQRMALKGEGPRVVWIRLHNTRKRELLGWFARALPKVLDALERGEVLIELI